MAIEVLHGEAEAMMEPAFKFGHLESAAAPFGDSVRFRWPDVWFREMTTGPSAAAQAAGLQSSNEDIEARRKAREERRRR